MLMSMRTYQQAAYGVSLGSQPRGVVHVRVFVTTASDDAGTDASTPSGTGILIATLTDAIAHMSPPE
jgi:hypothetical protein